MNTWPIVSARFPYIPVQVHLHDQIFEIEALIDTGFDGEVILPSGIVQSGTSPDGFTRWQMADGSIVEAPAYHAHIRIGGTTIDDGLVTALGDEALVGLGVIQHFAVTFDHGQRVIVEP